MRIIEHTVETTASPAQIWQLWQDVENWKKWDHALEFSRNDGAFQTGTTGLIKFKDSPILKTVLTRVEPLKGFVQEAKLFLARTVMTQTIAKSTGKTRVTFQVDVQGALAFFYAFLLGPSIKKKVPLEMQEMVKIAETSG